MMNRTGDLITFIIAGALLLLSACGDQVECTTNDAPIFTIQVRDIDNQKEELPIYIDTAYAEGVTRGFYSFQSSISNIQLYVNPNDSITTFVISDSLQEYSLTIAYDLEHRLISEDCGVNQQFTNVRLRNTNIADSAVQFNEGQSLQYQGTANMIWYRNDCDRISDFTWKVRFIDPVEDEFVRVHYDSVAGIRPDTLLVVTRQDSISSVNLPVDRTRPQSSFVFYDSLGNDTLHLSYRFNDVMLSPDCGKERRSDSLQIDKITWSNYNVVSTSLTKETSLNLEIYP